VRKSGRMPARRLNTAPSSVLIIVAPARAFLIINRHQRNSAKSPVRFCNIPRQEGGPSVGILPWFNPGRPPFAPDFVVCIGLLPGWRGKADETTRIYRFRGAASGLASGRVLADPQPAATYRIMSIWAKATSTLSPEYAPKRTFADHSAQKPDRDDGQNELCNDSR
jgi:hypothetical protein